MQALASHEVHRAVGSGWTTGRLVLAALLLAGGLFATRGAWEDIGRIALRDEEANHVWLVPLIAGWLVWVRRRLLLATEAAPSLLGPVLVAAGWALGHWGFHGAKQAPFQFGALLVAIGCLATVFGTRPLLAVWPAVLVLAMLVPVPGMLRQRMSIPLEQVTAVLTTGVLKIAGAPIDRSANQILINGYPVTVAEACNGLRMIFPLLLIVYVFCFLLPLRAWARVTLLLLSPAVAVACNVLRLLPTVLLYGYASKNTADRFHSYSGWPMVAVAFFVLMGIRAMLEALGLPLMQSRAVPSPGPNSEPGCPQPGN
jgi:exosortase